MRSVDDEAHQASGDGTSDGDSEDPACQEETDTLPVDGTKLAIAQTDTDRGTGDAHGSGGRQMILREDEDSDRSTKLH